MRTRGEVIMAICGNLEGCSILPVDILHVILNFAYDVRCGATSVQYWFWLHEPKATLVPPVRRRHRLEPKRRIFMRPR